MEPAPIIAVPEEFNRILIVLRDHATEVGLELSTVIDIASTFTCHAALPQHHLTIAAAVQLRLIHDDKGKLTISAFGREFLSHNTDSTYELAPGQALFLIHHCVVEGAYREDVKSLLAHSRRDAYAKRVWIDMREITLGPRQRILISFLRRIGFLTLRDHFLDVPTRHSILATALLRNKPITLQELRALLEERAQRGQKAEAWVLRYERERLMRAGFPLEASAVAIISDIDIAAGYDLESFDGESTGLMPDRFIEVKSTAAGEVVFFWSKNEIDAARSIGDRYWLYHLMKFTDQARCILTTFQAPIRRVDSGEFCLNPWSYQVTVRSK